MAGVEEKLHYEIFPVQGTTNERYIVLWVRETFFEATTSTPRETTLTDFLSGTEDVYKGDVLTAGFGSYILTDTLPKTNGCLRFVFLKNKTEAERIETVRTPYPNFEDIQWPNELRYLYAVKGEAIADVEIYSEDKASQWTTAGRTYLDNFHHKVLILDRYGVIPGGVYSTEVKIEEFFSPTPFTDLFEEQLVPTVVQYSWNGVQNNLSCLHDDVFVPEMLTSPQTQEGFGTKNAQSMTFSGQFFPKTNELAWREFFWRDRQIERDGGFYRKRITAFPPPAPPIHKL